MDKLTVSTGVSRGRETYGYTIVRLRSHDTGKVYRCSGGGYDMVGTVLADWLCDVHQDRLQAIASRAHMTHGMWSGYRDRLYGMRLDQDTGTVSVDGACGLSSVLRIAEAAGVDVQHKNVGPRRNQSVFYVSD